MTSSGLIFILALIWFLLTLWGSSFSCSHWCPPVTLIGVQSRFPKYFKGIEKYRPIYTACSVTTRQWTNRIKYPDTKLSPPDLKDNLPWLIYFCCLIIFKSCRARMDCEVSPHAGQSISTNLSLVWECSWVHSANNTEESEREQRSKTTAVHQKMLKWFRWW